MRNSLSHEWWVLLIKFMIGPTIHVKRKLRIYISIYIYIKAEDVAIYLPFGMYGNVFCMTRGSLVG
jgi:hypothetical protein